MPGVNDVDLEAIADFIKSLNPEIPWHLTRFFPQFKMQNVPPTPVSLLIRARQMALEKGLKYVYLGNVNLPGMENTVCPRCGNLLIERKGLFTVENYVEQGSCPAAAIKYMEDLEVEGETEAYFTTHLEYFYRFVPRNILGFLLGKYIPFFSHAWNFQLGPLALDLALWRLNSTFLWV